MFNVLDDDDFTVEMISKDDIDMFLGQGGELDFDTLGSIFRYSGNAYVLYSGNQRLKLQVFLSGGIPVLERTVFLPLNCNPDVEIQSLDDEYYVITISYSLDSVDYSKMIIVGGNGKVFREDLEFSTKTDLLSYSYKNRILISRC